jgi:hypothetical protein
MMAFAQKAAKAPTAIITSLRPASEPRRSWGDSSAR